MQKDTCANDAEKQEAIAKASALRVAVNTSVVIPVGLGCRSKGNTSRAAWRGPRCARAHNTSAVGHHSLHDLILESCLLLIDESWPYFKPLFANLSVSVLLSILLMAPAQQLSSPA